MIFLEVLKNLAKKKGKNSNFRIFRVPRIEMTSKRKKREREGGGGRKGEYIKKSPRFYNFLCQMATKRGGGECLTVFVLFLGWPPASAS